MSENVIRIPGNPIRIRTSKPKAPDIKKILKIINDAT